MVINSVDTIRTHRRSTYSVLKWLKVFGGVKYVRYDIRDSGAVVPPFGSAQTRHFKLRAGARPGAYGAPARSRFALATVSVMRLSGQTSQEGFRLLAALKRATIRQSRSRITSIPWRPRSVWEAHTSTLNPRIATSIIRALISRSSGSPSRPCYSFSWVLVGVGVRTPAALR
jgi:hypothetical protein